MLPGVSGLPILACACVIRPPFCGDDQLMGMANKPATPAAAANPNRTNRVLLCMGPSPCRPRSHTFLVPEQRTLRSAKRSFFDDIDLVQERNSLAFLFCPFESLRFVYLKGGLSVSDVE
jgi:hypothetical protein